MKNNFYRIFRFFCLKVPLLSLSVLFYYTSISHAQIVLDGTMGTAGALEGPHFSITEDLGTTMGANLFHSFSDFSIDAGESVTFFGPDKINNVFSRVTGGKPSTINGLLRSTIKEANLYFLNPAGVMFGANAELDIDGSFVVSTADNLKLGDDGCFDATQLENTVLTSSPVEAFGFFPNHSGSLSLDGSTLKVSDDHTLSLIGGEVHMTGSRLEGVSGDINIVSVGSEGEFAFDGVTQDSEINVDSLPDLGLIEISENSEIVFNALSEELETDVDAFDTLADNEMTPESPTAMGRQTGGRITIYSNDMMLDSSIIKVSTEVHVEGKVIDVNLTGHLEIINDGQLESISAGIGKGGDIYVSSETIFIEGQKYQEFTGIAALAMNKTKNGQGGNIEIDTMELHIISDGAISAQTFAGGNGGNISIRADSILLDSAISPLRTGIGAGPQAGSTGDGGNIEINTKTLKIFSGAGIETLTQGAGNGGNISIKAIDIELDRRQSALLTGIGVGSIPSKLVNVEAIDKATLICLASNFPELGNGGSIDVDTQNLIVSNGAAIDSGTNGAGNGGDIHINADSILLDGGDALNNNGIGARSGAVLAQVFDESFLSGIEITFEEVLFSVGLNLGSGGDIDITTGNLEIINSDGIDVTTFGNGNGGNIHVIADSISIENSPTPTPNSRQTGIGAETKLPDGGGKAGNVTIETRLLEINGHGRQAGINAITQGDGDGGNIAIISSEMILLDGGSREAVTGIGAFADEGADGNGGNIRIDTPALELHNATNISTASSGSGAAGDVVINGKSVTIDGQSSITSESSGTGAGGSVIVHSSDHLRVTNGMLSTQALLSNGGELTITSGDQILVKEGTITSQAGLDGGNIQLNTSRMIRLTDSTVTAKAGNNGGNIRIDPEFVIVNKSNLIAKAEEEKGGDITVVADVFLISSDSIIDVTSRNGPPGNFNVLAPDIDIAGSLAVLPGLLDMSTLQLQPGCATRLPEDFSTFTVEGKDGVLIPPDDFLPSY